MTTYYDDRVQGHITRDTDGNVTHVRYSQELRASEESAPLEAASVYLRELAGLMGLDRRHLETLNAPVQSLVPRDQGEEFRLEDEKALFDATTVSFVQTFFDVPVFRRGVAVKVKQGPSRIVGATANTESELHGRLPDPDRTQFYQRLFRGGAKFFDRAAHFEETEIPTEVAAASAEVQRLLGLRERDPKTYDARTTGLINGRFVAYRFHPELRFAGRSELRPDSTPVPVDEEPSGVEGNPPFPDIPPVNESIERGRTYLCAEMIVRHELPEFGELIWLLLVEVDTGSVLYIECQTCFINGMVFRVDPNVGSGDLTVTADDGDAVLQNHDSSEVLHNLNPPVSGSQSLRGTYVVVQNVEDPNIAAPTRPSGSNFDYAPRTNEFAAVNAYYHQTQLFRRIANLGFPITTYFNGTSFPTPVDHRGLGGANQINAHWSPNGTGGTGHQCYGLGDLTNIAQPLGRAVDPWVHWHEMGGHGSLGDHVGRGTFGFAHSAGDGLAALQMDPSSALRATADRFRYAPFRPSISRRFDRTWLWGGPQDDQGYGSEQILATCHFAIYRSIGGDHPDLGRRSFASRVATYLILRAIGQLTPGTNPDNWDPVALINVPGRGAQLWCEELQEADLEDWVTEGLSGAAYNKVIRWAFERQGSYGGQPPEIDVYIDDGRAGEYQFQPVHWANQSMWNRNAPDGLPGHQNAVSSATNYFYVAVKNRGTFTSGTVNVRGYHCLPGAGLTWPGDFTAMSPATGLSTPGIAGNSAEEVILGPFEWVPNENVYGHDCVLMIATTDGDPSNITHFTGAESIQEWRLVPNDNNVGQRNVSVVPGGGGAEALFSAMADAVFVAGNNLTRPAQMTLHTTTPKVLADKGWSLDVGDAAGGFRLAPGIKRTLRLRLVPGASFTADELRSEGVQAIDVRLKADGMEIGGVRYTIDPNLDHRSGGAPDSRPD
ncbi:hypothetical protein [Kocuria sp. LHG3120]|uniref:hypothetical protein n=1 Tax=Kocuria sp. LHG3120 TaxID=2804590 RepID=UPI003CEA7908